jgi:23S rRNA (cytosine1962-C5)-methyltransferase
MPRGRRQNSDHFRGASATPSLRWIEPALLEAFAVAQTSAHRLASGGGAWIERLGDDVLINHPEEATRDLLHCELQSWTANHALPIQRVFARFLPRHNEDRSAPELLPGDSALPLISTVSEEGVRSQLDFSAGYSVGLFLDQRANRRLLRRSTPRRVLNTFAYTCSFSVVAALAGAETVECRPFPQIARSGPRQF